jgi:hypothetical protein
MLELEYWLKLLELEFWLKLLELIQLLEEIPYHIPHLWAIVRIVCNFCCIWHNIIEQ